MKAPAYDVRAEELELMYDLVRTAWAGHRGGDAHEEYQGRLMDWILDKLLVVPESLYWSRNAGYEDRVVGWAEKDDPYRGSQDGVRTDDWAFVRAAWDGDVDPFVAATSSVDRWENVGIESGTGTGKTFWLACLALAFLACFKNSLVITAAPKQDQLLDKVWKEIERLWPRFQLLFPKARLMASGEIRMLDGPSRSWRAFAQVTGVRAGERSATKAQGDHAKHMLIITEETPGMHPAVMTAYENTRTGPYNVQVSVGNPDSQEDPLHAFCLQPDVRHIRVSAFDHPNVVTGDDDIVPGAVSRASISRRARKYEPMPAMFTTRVRGISPEQAVGVALRFRSAEHLRSWPLDTIRYAVAKKRWPLYLGIDFGAWRFAALWGTTDRAGGLHILRELFSQRESLEARARALVAQWEAFGAPRKVKAWGDPAGAQDIIELNNELRRLSKDRERRGLEPIRWRVRAAPRGPMDAEERKKGQRVAAVTRLNLLLGRQALNFAKELETDATRWRKGQHAGNEGEVMRCSRLLWEIKNWRYAEPKEGEAQPQDADDDSADGADAIASLRYMVMGWWKAAPPPDVQPKDNRNRDRGLEALLEERRAEQRSIGRGVRAARGGHLVRPGT